MGVVRVAVIDDGINSNVYPIKRVSARFEVKHGLILDCDDNPGVKSHGTCCAAIIEKYARVLLAQTFFSKTERKAAVFT